MSQDKREDGREEVKRTPPGNPTGRNQHTAKKEAAALPPGTDGLLEVMRHVKSSPVDLTYQHWESRQWKAKDEKEWQGQWLTLEKLAAERELLEARSSRAAPSPEAGGTIAGSASSTASTAPSWDGESPCPTCGREPPIPDAGTERALDLILGLRGE